MLKSQNSTIKSLAIQGFLSGKSRDQIAKETGVSAGKISYIINDWKRRIGIPDIEEIRSFVITVKKSGISMAQCTEGYRMSQLLKNLGVVDDKYDVITTNEEFGIDNNSNRITSLEVSNFVQNIYENCKKSGISPSIILSWIIDLHTVFGDCDDSRYSNLDNENNIDLNLKSNLNDIQSNPNPKQKGVGSLTQTQIPFISKVQRYIDQKKKELIDLKNYKKRLENENKRLAVQLNQKRFNLDLIKQEEKYVMYYIDWFYDLKREMWDNYSIDIKDFIRFARAVNNFKNNGFNISMIINECTTSSSLTEKIKTMKGNIEILGNQIIELNKSVSSLENEANHYQQTMSKCHELKGMGLGLHQLKQLHGIILEIADANNIPTEEAVSRFLKHVIDQYDNKLGFENIVNEKKDEICLVNRELNKSRQSLWFTPLIGPSLAYLFQKGVSEQDIICISQLVEICTINTDCSNLGVGTQNENSPKDTNNGTRVGNRLECGKQLISELKKYGNITIARKEQQEKRDTIMKEIDEMQKQKQEISVQCQNGIYFIKELYYKIAYFKEFMNRFNKDLDNKIKASSRFPVPLSIFIIYNNIEKGKNDGRGEPKEDQNK
jgi:hypothetical protein